MKILALIDPPHTLQPESNTVVAIFDGARRRGHTLFVCELSDLWLRNGNPGANIREVLALSRTEAPAVTVSSERVPQPLEHFDAVLIRKNPPHDTAYHLAMLIIEYARGKTLLVNDPRGLREANEKLYIFHFKDLAPPTLVTHRHRELREFLCEHGGKMVLKPLNRYGGAGIFYVHEDDPNTATIFDSITQGEQCAVMAQAYLPIEKLGDKRILLLDGEPMGIFLRMPQWPEIRASFSAGAAALPVAMNERDHYIVERLRPRLLQDGLRLVGLDVIGDYLTEVNVNSPGGIQAINEVYDVCSEDLVVDFLEKNAIS